MLDKPVGTCPYMVDEWRKGDQLIYKRFPDYSGDPAKTETLVFRWSSEAAQRLLEFSPARLTGSITRARRLRGDRG